MPIVCVMVTMKKLTRWLLVIGVLLLAVSDGWAQCAMCRSTLEANMSDGETANFAAGLNFGILYLFFTPYILLAVIGFFWYKNSKANGQKHRPSSHH